MVTPDWDDYRYFLATAQTGSLSVPQRELRTNQPTVGRRIAALEEVLGVRLFHRHARGMSLTGPARACAFGADDGRSRARRRSP